MLKSALIVLITLSLTACGVFRSSGNDYLKAEETAPIAVPAGKDNSSIGQIYVIPPIESTVVSSKEFELPRPRPVSANIFEETVKIQSFGGESWILINKPPTEIWPRLRNILNRSAIPSQRVDAATGVIETGWVNFKDDENTSHRFRFTIEPGIPLESSEVRILQTQTPAGSEQSEQAGVWPESDSQDPAREQEMIKLIANSLASDISSGTVSLLAQSIGGETKVEIVTPKVADPYVVIRLDFDRAWASVLYSLSRGGFSVTDQNRLAGEISVKYQPETEEEEPGFFSRLFSFGKKAESGETYLVLVSSVERGVEVRIAEEDKTGLGKEMAAELLKIIRSNLS